MGQVLSREALLGFAGQCRDDRRSIVFTNGCFDLLHPGHIRLLEECRALGDVLIVGINSDASVCAVKGPERPLIPEQERAEILAAMAAVDAVVIFDEPTPQQLIAALLPDILVKGSDWGENEIVGRAEVEAAGGRVVSLPLVPGYSTSRLVERVRQNRS